MTVRSHLHILRSFHPQTRLMGFQPADTDRGRENLGFIEQCEREGLILLIRFVADPFDYPGPSRPLKRIYEITPRGEAALAAMPT